jgi:hypothetical protein
MENILKDDYRIAVELYLDKKYSMALNKFKNVSEYGEEFQSLYQITDSANTYLPYIKALLLEEDRNYHNAYKAFENTYSFKDSKTHMKDCFAKYYYAQSEYIGSIINDQLLEKIFYDSLVKLFYELYCNVGKGREKIFYDSLYKQLIFYYEPIIKAKIIGDEMMYTSMPTKNGSHYKYYLCHSSTNYRNQKIVSMNPKEFSYADLVCFCVFTDQNGILDEWNKVQAYDPSISGYQNDYYYIKNHNELNLSRYYSKNLENIEKWLGQHFIF